MAAEVHALLTLVLLVGQTIRTAVQLVVQWAEQLLDECVRVLAVQVVGTLIPAAVVLHVWAFFKVANKV